MKKAMPKWHHFAWPNIANILFKINLLLKLWRHAARTADPPFGIMPLIENPLPMCFEAIMHKVF
jgi:hypothetical protein